MMIRTPQKCFHVQLFANPESVLFSSLFFSFYCMHTGDFCIVVLLIFAFCIFIFCIFIFFSETQLGFVPLPSPFLSLCCVQTFCVFLLKATCQPALSLAELVFLYVCICIFLEKKPVNLLSHQQNLYLYFYSYFS